MGATTTTTLTELVPQIESEARFWMLNASLFMPAVGKARNFLQLADLRNIAGDAYRFNKYAEITAGDATEGDDYTTTQALDSTGGVVVTATEKQVNIPVTDKVKRGFQFGPDKLIQDVGKAIGMAMAKKVDADVCGLFSTLGTSITTSGNPVTNADFQHYIASLATNEAPEPYAAFFHPWGWYEYVNESSSPVPDSSKSGPVGEELWTSYFVNRVMGVECYQSARCPNTDGTNYNGAFMSAYAIGMVLAADLRIEFERKGTARQDIAIGVMDYGVGVIDTTMGFSMLQDDD
jgi:hypothetical protein